MLWPKYLSASCLMAEVALSLQLGAKGGVLREAEDEIRHLCVGHSEEGWNWGGRGGGQALAGVNRCDRRLEI